MTLQNNEEPAFNPILHSNLWSIVKNVSRYADSEAENQAVKELTELVEAYSHKKLLEGKIEENKRYIGRYNGMLATLEDGGRPSIVQDTLSTLMKDFYKRAETLTQELEGKK